MKYSDFMKSKIFVDIQRWVFNGLAAISIAYFFCLAQCRKSGTLFVGN